MNTAEKIKVMQAWLDGEVIEVSEKGRCCWRERPQNWGIEWDWSRCDYRIKEQDYSLDIPWELIEDHWKYAAMDSGGFVYLCTERPESRPGYWGLPLGGNAVENFLIIKKPDVKHWEKTLTKRPEGK